MMTFRKLFVTSILIILGNSANGQTLQNGDYQLYSKFLAVFLKKESFDSIAVVREAVSDRSLYVRRDWPEKIKSLAVSFDSVGSISAEFEPRFQLKKKTVLVLSKHEIDSLFKNHLESKWADFLNKYPGCAAIIKMSRIAFTRDKKTAMIYVAFRFSDGTSAGYIVYFNPKRIRIHEKRRNIMDRNLRIIWVS